MLMIGEVVKMTQNRSEREPAMRTFSRLVIKTVYLPLCKVDDKLF